MNLADIISLELSIGKGTKSLSLANHAFEVSISDSIYRISPEVRVTIEDQGILTSRRMGGYGVNWNFTLQTNNKSFTYPLRADSQEINSRGNNSSVSIAGNFSTLLKHSFVFLPSVVKAYKGKTPNTVLSDIINEYGKNNFQAVETSSASKLDMEVIYNPALRPSEFIEKILLPLSSSTTSTLNSPFYAFIDSQNRLIFKDLVSLLQGKSVKAIQLKDSIALVGDPKKTINSFDAIPFSQLYSHIYDSIDTEICSIDANGKFSAVDTSLKNIAPKMPFYNRKKSLRRYMSEDEFQTPDAYMRYQSGINNKLRAGYLTDKLVIRTPFDLDLTAGRKVTLKSFMSYSGEEMLSYSGDYIIESSVHSWNALSNSGTTQIVVGTPSPSIKETIIEKSYYKG